MTVNDIFDYLKILAPIEDQESWDNSGLLIGDKNADVSKALLALDATSDVIEEAHKTGCNLIITHHPIIFESINTVLQNDITGNKIIKLAKYGISFISMHTNLDKSMVNRSLIEQLGVEQYTQVSDYMCIGILNQPQELLSYIDLVKKSLDNDAVRYFDSGRPVYKIASSSGSGGFSINSAYENECDTFITADIKHSTWLAAKELNMNLIDADHFNTENVVIPVLCNLLNDHFNSNIFSVAKTNIKVICYA